MKLVAVTGANGYLGRFLLKSLRNSGYSTLALSRSNKINEDQVWRKFELNSPLNDEALKDVDVLIHCAHDFGPRSLEDSLKVNVDGTRKLFHAARKNGVRCIIFISSMAAFKGCQSVYGQVKLAADDVAKEYGAWIIKPATIYTASNSEGDTEGLFGMLRKLAVKLPVVPLIDGGKQPLYLIAIEDLSQAIIQLVERPEESVSTDAIRLGANEPVQLKTILKQLAKYAGKRPLFISVPRQLILWPLLLVEKLKIPIPVRSDSLISLCNLDPKPNVQDRLFKACMRGFCAS